MIKSLIEQHLLEASHWPRRIVLAIACGLALALAYKAAHAGDITDIPREQPLTSTGFVYCTDGKKLIVGVVITYPSGKVLRFSKDHMHGISVADLVKYADSVQDSAIYGAGACDSTNT